jgi:uncharacterized protein YjeT (DUF2065 family)
MEVTMRAFGLLLIIVGLVAFALPAYPALVVGLPIGPNELRTVGGILFILGGATLWFTRSG